MSTNAGIDFYKMKSVKETILNLLHEIRPEFDFSESDDFIGSGMLDSFDVVQLVNGLDEAYGISIDGTDILPENFSSIEKIVALLDKIGVKP